MGAPRRTSLPQVPLATPPPFRLPGEFFAAALIWLGVVAAGLPWLAPRLAQGAVLDPPVFGLVHAAVLGVIGSAIFGALHQFVPGGLSVPLRSVRLGHWGFWLFQAGTVALVAGFWRWTGWLQLAGWLLLFGGVSAVSVNILPARRRSPHGKLVGLYLSVAHSALGTGMAIGLARIGETLGLWHLDRLRLLAAHLQLGAIGFGLLTAVGVGSRMLPTFLIAQGDDTRRLQWTLGLASAGLAAFTIGALTGWGWLIRGAAALLMVSGVLILELARQWFRRRKRALDPSLWHVASSFVGIAAALGWGAALAIGDPFSLRRWAAYMVALVLAGLLMLVIGVMAKLVSHLSYIHLFRIMPGFARVGNPNLLLRSDWMMAAWALLTAGSLGLPAALDMGAPRLALGAALVWSGGVAVTLANYCRMFALGRWAGMGPSASAGMGASTVP